MAVSGAVTVENVHGGNTLSVGSLDVDSRPNKIPRGCAMRIWKWSGEDGDDLDESKVSILSNTKIAAKCIDGHTVCDEEGFSFEGIREIAECEVIRDLYFERTVFATIRGQSVMNRTVAAFVVWLCFLCLSVIGVRMLTVCRRNKFGREDSECVPLLSNTANGEGL